MSSSYQREIEKYELIQFILCHNVPRFIQCIKDRGGPCPEELEWLACCDVSNSKTDKIEDPDESYLYGLLMRADNLLIYAPSTEIFLKSMTTLVKGLAIMAFFPTGVHAFDIWFDSKVDGFIKDIKLPLWKVYAESS